MPDIQLPPYHGSPVYPPRPAPDDLVVSQSVVYRVTPQRRLVMDIYWRNTDTPAPLMIWIHGGGFRQGTHNGSVPALHLLDRGYAVASITYRLSGEAIFPEPMKDVKAAVRWLRAHAHHYNFDPERFSAWGGSAGGYFAHMLALTGHTDVFDDGDHLDVSGAIQAACSWCGPTDLSRRMEFPPGVTPLHDYNAPESIISRFLGGMVKEIPEQARRSNPVTYVRSDVAPVLFLHGEVDNAVSVKQSQLLYEAMINAGATAEIETFPTLTHTFYQNDEQYEYVLNRTADFLDAQLGNQ